MAAESVEIVLNGVDNASPTIEKVNSKLVSSEEKYISKLKEQLIALQDGAEAAERFKLAEMGFSEATIESAMAIKQQIDELKNAQAEWEATIQPIENTKNAMEEASEVSVNTSGVFAKVFGALGMSELQSFANKMGGLTKEVEQLEEAGDDVGKAFKGVAVAGMAIGTAVAAFNIGKMIGDWIWQTEKWKQALKDALNEVGTGEQRVRDQLDKQFKLRLQIAQAAGSDEQQKKELKALQDKIKFDIENQRAMLSMAKAAAEKAEKGNSWGIGGLNQGEVDRTKQALSDEQKKLELLEQQLQTVREITDPSAQQQELEKRLKVKEADQAIADLQKEIAAIQDPKKAELELLLKQAANDEQRKTLELLWQEKEATQAKVDAEKQAYDELRKAFADGQKDLEDRKKKEEDYLKALQVRNEELTNGKRAADEMKASMEGISDEVIMQGRELSIQNELLEAQKQLADEQKKKDEELAKKMATPAPQLQAMQYRLLTRSGQSNLGERQAKANEKVAELTQKIEGLQREQQKLLEDIRVNTREKIKMVG